MRRALVTGGSGFLGSLLVKRLLDEGWSVWNIDLRPDEQRQERLVSIQGDIRDTLLLDRLFEQGRFEVVFHLAAILGHGKVDEHFLWASNVEGTKAIAAAAGKYKVPHIVHTSSNCLWAEPFGRPVREDDEPRPAEIYGRSKWEGEKTLLDPKSELTAVVVRCPTIVDAGRLGLLAILFEFIDEGRRVWVVGEGSNRYQFIYAPDLIDALLLAAGHRERALFGVGSENVKSLREVYQHVIDRAGSGARVVSLPKGAALAAMKLAHKLGVSPLGPYHYKMIAEDFSFDISRIKRELGWKPTLTNEEMLFRAFQYYREHKADIRGRSDVSAHRQAAKMGIIRVLKWVS